MHSVHNHHAQSWAPPKHGLPHLVTGALLWSRYGMHGICSGVLMPQAMQLLPACSLVSTAGQVDAKELAGHLRRLLRHLLWLLAQ